VPRCAECPSAIDVARQSVSYAGPAPAIVIALKDRRLRSLAAPIAAVMATRIPAPPPGVTLVPVPLASDRQRERGFNQAALIAHELGRVWRLPVSTPIIRLRGAPTQRGSSVTERRAQVRGAFAPDGSAAPSAVCLVDDVHTTGATLTACAKALRAGGAKRVGAVAFARVTTGSPGATI
jgi:ComF family protein